jgi:hypothetical protein
MLIADLISLGGIFLIIILAHFSYKYLESRFINVGAKYW